MGIYNENGVLQGSSGSTAQAGTSVIQAVDTADVRLQAGRYYMALACDNTTATFYAVTAADAKTLGMAQMASAFPLPATVTLATLTSSYLPRFGFSLRTLVT